MKYKKKTLTDELNGTTKKKYVSPSLRLCQALSLKCVMNEGPASFMTKADDEGADEDEDIGNGGLPKHSKSFFYSGYDSAY